MRMNLIRQPLLPAFLTLVAIAAVAVFGREAVPVPVDFEPSVLAGMLAMFEALYPGWARVAAFFSILVAGLCLGRMVNRYNLYSGGCYLTLPLFGLIVCGVFPASALLSRYVVALLFAWASYRFCGSLRNGYSFSELFRASLLTGLIPLFVAPAIGFVLLVPLALLLFKRTAREVVVALFGLLLPPFVLCYLTWAWCGDFLTPITTFSEALTAQIRATPVVFDPAPLFLPAYALLLTLGALLMHATNFYVLSQKGRLIILFYILILPLTTILCLLPSASASVLALMAVPSSVLIPLFFVRIRHFIAVLLFLSLLLLGLGSILFV